MAGQAPLSSVRQQHNAPEKMERVPVDRRRMDDRRQHYSLDYFDRGGQERRRNAQNRRQVREEQRQGWIRVSEWTSCYIGSGNMCLAANT